MGLDMYLSRAPKYRGTTIEQISTMEQYFRWQEDKTAQEYTFEKWCGAKEKDLPCQEVQDYYKQFYNIKYYYWDDEHKYGRNNICEHIGYWRKANAIHRWFVDNVQDSVDDCGYYEVNKEQIAELLEICKKIKDNSKLVKGKIANGYHFENGKQIYDMEDGMYIENPAIAQEYLPTQSGFFFGSTDYDEYYLQDIEETIKILTNVLETTNFDTQMIVYDSSW